MHALNFSLLLSNVHALKLLGLSLTVRAVCDKASHKETTGTGSQLTSQLPSCSQAVEDLVVLADTEVSKTTD